MDVESSQPAGLIGVLAWVEANKKRLLIGAVAALFVSCLIFGFVQRQVQKEQAASQALSDVRLPISAGTPSPAGTADALLKVAADHKGTKAAARAMLLSAGLLFAENTEKGYTEALKRFTDVAQNYPDSPWLAEANLGVASSLAALGKTNEATAKFEEIRRRFASSPIINEAKLGLARLYEGSKPEEAFKLYEELGKEAAGTAVAMEAGMRQEDLLKLHPEFAKLREPPVPPNIPTPPLNQSIKVTPTTNRAVATGSNALTNAVTRVLTNLTPLALTNRPGTNPPVSLKLAPVPAPQK